MTLANLWSVEGLGTQMNRKLIVVCALLIAVVGVVGIWMPQIRQWQNERAYREGRKRAAAASKREAAFLDRWLIQVPPHPSDAWFHQTRLKFCADPDLHLVSPTARIAVETNLLTGAPNGDDGCGDE